MNESQEEDIETCSNTSLNEVVQSDNVELSRISESCEDASCFDDDVIVSNDFTSIQNRHSKASSSSTTFYSASSVSSLEELRSPINKRPMENIYVVSENVESKPAVEEQTRPKSCLKTPPIISKKPELLPKYGTSSGNNPFVGTNHVEYLRKPDVQEMVKEIADLKQKLETERRRNAELAQQVIGKDESINELTSEIQALNEDLDAVDEEFKGLEAENKALLKAMAHLNTTPSKHKH